MPFCKLQYLFAIFFAKSKKYCKTALCACRDRIFPPRQAQILQVYIINSVQPERLKYSAFSRSASSLTLKCSARHEMHINSAAPRFTSLRCRAISVGVSSRPHFIHTLLPFIYNNYRGFSPQRTIFALYTRKSCMGTTGQKKSCFTPMCSPVRISVMSSPAPVKEGIP